MTETASGMFADQLRFRRFRLNLIEFLKLPHDIGEDQLREVIMRSSATLLRTYDDRAARVRPRLAEESRV